MENHSNAVSLYREYMKIRKSQKKNGLTISLSTFESRIARQRKIQENLTKMGYQLMSINNGISLATIVARP